jgi:hypothetical protein
MARGKSVALMPALFNLGLSGLLEVLVFLGALADRASAAWPPMRR